MYPTYLMQGTQYASLSRLLLLYSTLTLLDHFITYLPTYITLITLISYNRFHFISLHFF